RHLIGRLPGFVGDVALGLLAALLDAAVGAGIGAGRDRAVAHLAGRRQAPAVIGNGLVGRVLFIGAPQLLVQLLFCFGVLFLVNLVLRALPRTHFQRQFLVRQQRERRDQFAQGEPLMPPFLPVFELLAERPFLIRRRSGKVHIRVDRGQIK